MASSSRLSNIYNSWLLRVQDNIKNQENFVRLSDYERINYFRDLLKTNPVKLFLDEVGKNKSVSQRFREAGNKSYGALSFEIALELYTKSIAFAPGDSKELALALGNRAACLLYLGHIAEALVDVQRASNITNIDEDYKEKLLKRQDVCINRIIETKEISKSNHLPLTLSSSNNYFDSASNKIKLLENAQLGRHLITTSYVKTGEILIIDKPYSYVLLPEHYYTLCSKCFIASPALLECSSCSATLYCSTDCLGKDKARHKYECQITERLYKLGMSKLEFLALRTLIDAAVNGENITSASEKSVNNVFETNKYDTLDFQRAFDLVGNSEKRTASDLMTRTFTALAFVEALRQFTTFLTDFAIDESVAGSFILHFLQSLPCNAHEITHDVDGDVREIGAGLFSTLSLLNHSCDPNVVRHSVGLEVVLRAIRPIRAGEEIVDNYGYHYATHTKGERYNSLLRQYHFKCGCEACVGAWPMYTEIPNKIPQVKDHTEANKKRYEKLTEEFEIRLDLVLQKEITTETLNFLCSYLDFLDDYLKKPWQNFNKCQEALKFGWNFCKEFQVL